MTTRVRARGEEVRRFIVEHVERHPRDIGRVTAERFEITRQAVNKHLKKLASEGRLTGSGKTRRRIYVPVAPPAPSPYSSHRLLEARSLAMHAVIAAKITRHPALLAKPRQNLERWSVRYSNDLPRWMVEWRRTLERPWSQIAALITEPSENAARLRQSSPFAGVLTAAERKRIYEAFRA
jgi:hypothetical protein